MSDNRIGSLRQDIERAIAKITHGTPNVVKRKRYFAQTLVTDLIEIHAIVPRLAGLHIPTIKKLILLWQERGNDLKTIHNKVSMLREIVHLAAGEAHFPDNKALGLEKIIPKKPAMAVASACLPVITPEAIVDERIRPLCALQRHFGLKKREAIHFSYRWLQADSICLSRLAAYNSKNRVIPLWNPTQIDLLRKLENEDVLPFIRELYSAKLLSTVHQYALLTFGIHDEDYFRHQYIQERAVMLGLDKHNASSSGFHQLRQELGYQRNETLKEQLTCLGVY